MNELEFDIEQESDVCIITLFNWIQYIKVIRKIIQTDDDLEKWQHFIELEKRVVHNMSIFEEDEDFLEYETVLREEIDKRGLPMEDLS